MSRGLGKIERQVLELLQARDRDRPTKKLFPFMMTAQIVYRVFPETAGVPDPPGKEGGKRLPTHAEEESVRRAIRSLERKGFIVRTSDGRAGFWGVPEAEWDGLEA